MIKVAAGATHMMSAHRIYFCRSGLGAMGAEPVRFCTTIHLGQGETAAVTAREDLVFLRLGLPDLRGLEAGGKVTARPLAAE